VEVSYGLYVLLLLGGQHVWGANFLLMVPQFGRDLVVVGFGVRTDLDVDQVLNRLVGRGLHHPQAFEVVVSLGQVPAGEPF
jgi:hypothetical protein